MEGTDTTAGEGTNAGAAEGVKETPKAEAKKEPAKEAPKAEAKKEPAAPAPKELGADDEIPDDTELVSMSKTALAKRLDRHTKKELRERFGTDDQEKIKADLAELADLRAKRDEKRRAEMSENDKLKEDLAKERKAREDAEAKAQKTVDAQTFAEYDTTAKEVFGDKIAPKHVKRAMRELKEHIMGLDESETPSDPKKAKKVFDKWTKEWLAENPEFAKQVEEPKKIPLNTGANPKRPEKGESNLAHKTAKPGQVNSMSRAEYNEFKRSRGLS